MRHQTSARGWIGVDLDGTLAHYDGWQGAEHIGAPIPRMLERVKAWLDNGLDVRIFTARVAMAENREAVQAVIDAWCVEHIGVALPVTCSKDYGMAELWDDRCVQIVCNTGERADTFVPCPDCGDDLRVSCSTCGFSAMAPRGER